MQEFTPEEAIVPSRVSFSYSLLLPFSPLFYEAIQIQFTELIRVKILVQPGPTSIPLSLGRSRLRRPILLVERAG